MKKIALTLVLSSALLGLGTVTMAQDSKPVAPDNSAVNVRDRAPDAMTAGEQSSATNDVALTRNIRRAVIRDHSLSMLAHNVKIVSATGNVTLRGPAGNVDNQLEVKTQ